MGKTFKILTIDGGGIKGLYSAQVLAKMEEKFNCKLSDKFDLICGTSTGAILALAVSLKVPMSEAVTFYEQKGPKIFNQRRKQIPGYSFYLAIKQALISPKYNSCNLEDALTEVFGSHTMSDCQNMVCIPALNINDASCCIFKKDFGTNSRDNKKTCVDVALASAAAPTFFPVKEIDDHQYADGGLYANNPTLVGLLEFIYKILPQFPENDYDSVDILSVSSCEKASGQKHGRKNKSFWNWKSTLFDAYSQGQAKFEAFLLTQIIPHLNFKVNFYRVKNEVLPSEISSLIELDNASKSSLKELKAIGKRTADNENVKPEVRHFFQTNKTIQYSYHGK
jgi:hypothetical protein